MRCFSARGNVTDAFVGKVYRRRKPPGEKRGPAAENYEGNRLVSLFPFERVC